MKARHVFAFVIAGAMAAVAGYFTGIEVGFRGGVRAASDVFGAHPKKVFKLIAERNQSAKERNPRMGD